MAEPLITLQLTAAPRACIAGHILPLANADAADLHLLRLMGCVALATVLLALATGLTA